MLLNHLSIPLAQIYRRFTDAFAGSHMHLCPDAFIYLSYHILHISPPKATFNHSSKGEYKWLQFLLACHPQRWFSESNILFSRRSPTCADAFYRWRVWPTQRHYTLPIIHVIFKSRAWDEYTTGSSIQQVLLSHFRPASFSSISFGPMLSLMEVTKHCTGRILSGAVPSKTSLPQTAWIGGKHGLMGLRTHRGQWILPREANNTPSQSMYIRKWRRHFRSMLSGVSQDSLKLSQLSMNKEIKSHSGIHPRAIWLCSVSMQMTVEGNVTDSKSDCLTAALKFAHNLPREWRFNGLNFLPGRDGNMSRVPMRRTTYLLNGLCQFLLLIVEDEGSFFPFEMLHQWHQRLWYLRVVWLGSSEGWEQFLVRHVVIGAELQKRKQSVRIIPETSLRRLIGLIHQSHSHMTQHSSMWQICMVAGNGILVMREGPISRSFAPFSCSLA